MNISSHSEIERELTSQRGEQAPQSSEIVNILTKNEPLVTQLPLPNVKQEQGYFQRGEIQVGWAKIKDVKLDKFIRIMVTTIPVKNTIYKDTAEPESEVYRLFNQGRIADLLISKKEGHLFVQWIESYKGPLYKYAGLALMEFAFEKSKAAGLDGKIELLAPSEAQGFYTKLGFQDGCYDEPVKEGHMYLPLDFLKDRGESVWVELL